MRILGLDVATTTGWAFYDPALPMAAIVSGSFRVQGKTPEEKAYDIASRMIRLFKEHKKPDFIVIEQPIRTAPVQKKAQKFMGQDTGAFQAQAGGLNAVISSNQLVGSIVGLIRGYGLSFEMVGSSSWRSNSFGFGTRKGWQRQDWKRHAKDRCAQMRIDVRNADEAEAVWIAFYGPKCQRYKLIENQVSAA